MEQNRENAETEPSMYRHFLIIGTKSVGHPHGENMKLESYLNQIICRWSVDINGKIKQASGR